MTTITDNFNRADGDIGSSSEGWSWTQTSGDLNIASNEAVNGVTSAFNYGRAESDLSSDEHYSQIVLVAWNATPGAEAVGVMTRYSASANSGILWYCRRDASNYRLFRVTAGSLTQIGSTLSEALPTPPFTIRLESDGADLHTGKMNGTTKVTATDATYAGNTRCGFEITRSGGTLINRCDDFEAGDLAAGSSTTLYLHSLIGVGI